MVISQLFLVENSQQCSQPLRHSMQLVGWQGSFLMAYICIWETRNNCVYFCQNVTWKGPFQREHSHSTIIFFRGCVTIRGVIYNNLKPIRTPRLSTIVDHTHRPAFAPTPYPGIPNKLDVSKTRLYIKSMWNQSFSCYNKQGNQQKTAALTKLLVTNKNIKQLPCYELQLMNHNINHLENHLLVTRIIYFFQVFVRYSPRQIGLPKGRLLSGTSKPARLMPNKNSPKTAGFFGQKSKGSWWSISNLLNNFFVGWFFGKCTDVHGCTIHGSYMASE